MERIFNLDVALYLVVFHEQSGFVFINSSVLPLEEDAEFLGMDNIDLDSDDSEGFASEGNVC